MRIYRSTIDFAFRRFSGSMVRWTSAASLLRSDGQDDEGTVGP